MGVALCRGRVKFRECLRGERWLYDLTAANPDILACIKELIGEPVPPERPPYEPAPGEPQEPPEGLLGRIG